MTFYFVGGEDSDFVKIGTAVVNTATTAARRTANARCTLGVGGSASVNDGWQATFNAAIVDFWFTTRVYATTAWSTQDWLVFLDGANRRLIIKSDASGHIIIATRDTTPTTTTLATSTLVMGLTVLYKIDVQVNYDATGTVNVYVDGLLWVTYSGDVTTNGATSLSGFVLGNTSNHALAAMLWSEIVCGTEDTRHMSLITLPPAANGNTFAWTNTFASVDEVTLNDADLCASDTANQVMQTTVTSSGVTGTPAIRAVAVSARAMKGASGPTQIQMAVRTGGTDYFSATKALDTSFGRVDNIWETNPNTTAAWVHTDTTAVGFNIGAKSIA